MVLYTVVKFAVVTLEFYPLSNFPYAYIRTYTYRALLTLRIVIPLIYS